MTWLPFGAAAVAEVTPTRVTVERGCACGRNSAIAMAAVPSAHREGLDTAAGAACLPISCAHIEKKAV